MKRTELVENIKRKGSFLCVGLDPDIKKVPEHLLNDECPLFAFNKAIIDATAPYTVAYKPNLAFYESLGVEGWIALEKTINYLKENHPDQFIIADAKRGILVIHHNFMLAVSLSILMLMQSQLLLIWAKTALLRSSDMKANG